MLRAQIISQIPFDLFTVELRIAIGIEETGFSGSSVQVML
jgi:hypothetical protein